MAVYLDDSEIPKKHSDATTLPYSGINNYNVIRSNRSAWMLTANQR